MNKVISFQIEKDAIDLLIKTYQEYQQMPNSEYVSFFAKTKYYSVQLYTSGKVVFQGDINEQELVKFGYKPFEWLIDYSHIGSDEVGTGDYFGPVIVSSAYVSKSNFKFLENLGIKDSKKLSDKKILEIVPKFISVIPHKTLMLDNRQYNALNDEYNLNKFKAVLHNNALLMLFKDTKCDNFVVDQFCSKEKFYEYIKDEKEIAREIRFETKGESKSIAVAAASMIARYTFLIKMKELEDKYQIKLPLGEGKAVVELAKQLESECPDILEKIAKVNFKLKK